MSVKRQVDSAPETAARVRGDASSDPIVRVGEYPCPRSQVARYLTTGRVEWTPEQLDRLSVSDYALVTGDYGPFDRAVAGFLADERAKVDRAYRQLTRLQCGRCDHLQAHHDRLMPDGRRGSWPGPCAFAFCGCPGPESPG